MNQRKRLKTRTQITSYINTELLNELKKYSSDTQIPMSKLLDKAIKLLLESVK